MPVPAAYRDKILYHFTHIDNLPGILQYGLLSTNEKLRLRLPHRNIAYEEIQGRRADMEVTCEPGGVVHDYVPLYFCKRSPMLLAVIQNKIADEQLIIYLEFPILIMEQLQCVFTSHSANTIPAPTFYDDLANLDNLDWNAIDTWRWGNRYNTVGQLPVKQLKMAEILLPTRIDPLLANKIIVWNGTVTKEVKRIYQDAGITPPPIEEGDRTYFYLDRSKGNVPPVTGPYFIHRTYIETKKRALEKLGTGTSPLHETISDLLGALRNSMQALPETAELVGLESVNEMHQKDVGTHTQNVVAALKALPEFHHLNSEDQACTELAAFLHDIGKGPKSRWAGNGGKQAVDPDHPIKGLPMVERILVDEVQEITDRQAWMVLKLVCYHDLVGDIVGKGRCPEEFENVAKTERQLNMLIALGKADMKSVNLMWVITHRAAIDELRQRVANHIQRTKADDE